MVLNAPWEFLEFRRQAYVLRGRLDSEIQTPSGDRLTCAQAVSELLGGPLVLAGPLGRRGIDGLPLARVGVSCHRHSPPPPFVRRHLATHDSLGLNQHQARLHTAIARHTVLITTASRSARPPPRSYL
ncbi:hypothetical protein [Micromonospora sp. LOL_021]|uniref:hypothetical protein n=1 Tax=Micromonospora sp. LOL_021 TaxID=3345417 RepID=UPI003A89D0B8